MTCLTRFSTPQLELLHRGKVRDSFRVDPSTRMIVVTDRISAFDHVLETPVPSKGAVLNSLSAFWFEQTRSIVPNHMMSAIDPQVMLVREASPIRVEMVVRGYLTGSMWRAYEKGKRSFSGTEVPDALKKNQKLPRPLLTPTTKEESDREIAPTQIVETGLASRETYAAMEKAALELFRVGTELLASKGLLLVDTKYEFGMADGRLILIDEIHTPDSSRFWSAEDWQRDPATCVEMDKEYVRRWLLEHTANGEMPLSLPDDVIAEASRRYLALFERVAGHPLGLPAGDSRERIYQSLLRAKAIKDAYVVVVMGSANDLPHCQKIKEALTPYGVAVDLRVVSAHRNGEQLAAMAEEYNGAVEPGAAIAVAGMSNGLGGALAANLAIPVINCPPFKDQTDLLLNVNSSLMMPSRLPAATVLGADNAALAALRSLGLRRLRDRFIAEIADTKARMLEDDERVRGRG
jgi:phosphoribosylaminoimidazole-succinocarboxamide synthase